MKEKAIGKIIGGLLICLMLGLVFGGLIDVTSATTEKTTVSVTESSPWFTKGTNSGSGPWYPHTYEGHDYISTYVGGMSGNPSQPDCWAEFKPYLSQSGKYEVYAYFYACKDTSTKVPFTVKYDGGSTTIKVNQYRSSPTWKEKYLGTWDFKAGADTCVKVTDATGETYNGITGLSVGAIKFVKVQTTTVSSPPTLISPGSSSEPGQEINTLTPTFKWNSVFNADYYGLYVSKYPYGSSNIVFEKEGLYGTSFTLPSGKLQDGVKYRWNMRAHNSAGWSGFSSKLYFTVNIPQPPSPLTLISPGSSSEPGQEINTLTPTFKWNSVSNADYYGLYVSKYPYGSSNIVFEKEGIYGTSFTLPSGKLQDGVKYRWNMRAHNSAGWSGFSSKLYFTVDIPQPPSPPTLISPGSSSEPGQEINTLTPTFKWNSVSNADYYGLYVSKYPYGSSNIVFEKEGIYGTSFTLPSGKLQDGVKYRWNMRAHNSAGWSGFSSKLYFTVDIPQPPSPPTLISPGSSSEPGQEINTLTPTFKWNSVSNADYYGLYLSKYPYGSSNIVFEKEGIYGTSFTLPSGKLQDGVKYRWNMRAHNSAGWSGFSSKLYFTVNLPNSPPNTPSKPSGPSSGYTGTSYSYSTSATDPDGDQVKYTFDWGDGTTSENNFVNSGTSASKSHSWSSAGTYSVKAKAADSKGSSSGWSSSKTVTITQQNLEIPTPVISGIDPSRPIACSGKQWITIIGTGFVSDSTVTLCIGSSTYPIPADRTEFKSSSQIRVYVGLTDPGTWTARVTNQGNRLSNLFSFTVKQDIPSPVHDMAVTNVYTTPSSPNVGQTTTIYVTVKNEGNQQENNVPVKAHVDGSQVGSTQHVTLSAGKSTTKSFTWTPSTAKAYSVKGAVGIVSGETDTSDNKKTISMEVIPAPVHDMAVTKVYTSPDSPIVGQATTIYVTVKNEGNQQENSVPVKAYVDGSKISTQYVTLSADQSTTKSFTWTPSVAKTYSVKGEVGAVSGETDTSDNSKTKSVTVNPAPVRDMAVTDVQTSPDLPTVGQSTTIYVTVKNKGNQQEKNVPVKAYVDGSQVGSTQVTLSAGESITKSFIWTPSTAKTYSVKGEVGIVSGETYTRDNTKTISVSVSPAPSSLPTTTPSPQTGSIIVTAILDQATFTITGPKTYHGSGKSWSEPNAPVGTYRIIYEAVVKKENGKAVGYDVLKKSEEKTLIAGGSVRFDVEYIKNTPPTRGKISYFCPSCCPTSAWEEPLGESCGKDDAAKYWFVAMRWPYAKWDYNIEDTVSTGLSKGSDWKNKKILVTNPKNGRQVVLEAKDWGPAPWTGRVIDVSPTALGALDAETDEEVNIEFADKNAELGPPPSTKFKTGDLIVTKKKWNLRSDRKIAEECIKTTLDKGSEGEVLENDDNGKFVPDNKHYWWYVKIGDYEGWCAEDGLEKSETVPKSAKPVITSPLEITAKDIYYVGDTLTAEFTISNRAAKSVTFDVLVVGGRDPTGEVVDFDKTYDVALNQGNSYDYEGYLTLPNKPGIYHFFCAYHTEEHMPGEDEYNWNTNIDVEIEGKIVEDFSEAKKYREQDIIVFEETYISPAPSPVLWKEIHGPWEDKRSEVSQIAVHPNNPEVVYTAMKHYHYYWGYEGDELYKSTDGGDSWIPVNHGLPGLTLSEYYWPIRAIAIAPSNPDIIYVGTSDLNPYSSLLPSAKGIYKSTNGGSEWTSVGGPYTGKWIFKTYCSISSMVVDPIDPNTVYAGTVGGGIWRTTNGGEFWERIWDEPVNKETLLDVSALAISPANPNTIYATAYNFDPVNAMGWSGILIPNRFIKSEDGGDTWERLRLGILTAAPKIDDIAVDYKNADIVYVITEHYKVYNSTDGGKNWDDASGTGGSNPLPYVFRPWSIGKSGSICIHPDYSNVIYAAGEWVFKYVYFSSDSGENWFPFRDLKDKHVKEIVLASTANSRVIYAAAIEGLFKVDISEPEENEMMIKVVEEGDYVRVDYTGKLEGGTVFDTSMKDVAIDAGIYNQKRDYQPLGFTVGAGEMINGFDKGVVGMIVGEDKTLTIPADQAYGPYRADLVQVVARDQLPPDSEREVGQVLQASQPNGQIILVTITNVTDSNVTLDANHRLAGKTLIFDVTLVSIGGE